LIYYRLGASSSNVDLSVVSDKFDSAISSEPCSGRSLFAQELPKEFSLPLATDKSLDVSGVKFFSSIIEIMMPKPLYHADYML
jgi:phosphoglucan, water dikinase